MFKEWIGRRWILANAPPVEPTALTSKEYMLSVWKQDAQDLLEGMKQELFSNSTLERPDWDRRFYLKTDWSKFAIGAVLCQDNPEDEVAFKAKQIGTVGSPCLFEKAKSHKVSG